MDLCTVHVGDVHEFGRRDGGEGCGFPSGGVGAEALGGAKVDLQREPATPRAHARGEREERGEMWNGHGGPVSSKGVWMGWNRFVRNARPPPRALQ